jgi:SPP1 gp7 family putative phage head morphogenesis protein
MPDPTPQILELSNEYRDRLLRRERQAATALVRYYGESWRRLQGDINGLQVEVDALRAQGEDIGPGKLWRLQRMKAIQRQAEQELARYADLAEQTIANGQREAIAAAERDAPNLVRAAFPADAGIDISFAQVPREAVEQMIGFLQDGSPLVDVLRKHVGDAAQRFGDTLVNAMVMGWNPRKTAREIRAAFGMGLTDSLRIARQEQMRAYRAATLNSYRANSDVVKEWERLAAQDDRTCMACILLDGRRYKLEEDMDDHIQGRCTPIPVTYTYREMGIDVDEPDFTREKAQDWFQRQDEATQRRMIGPGMFDAWKAGTFDLTDIPKVIKSDVWGNSWVPKGLRELVGEARAVLEWQPAMSRGDAAAWSADSQYTGDMYHVTDYRNEASIKAAGFDLTKEKFGRVWGDGVYVTPSMSVADQYVEWVEQRGRAERLAIKIDVRNVLEVEASKVLSKEDIAIQAGVREAYREYWGYQNMKASAALTRALQEKGYDAVHIFAPQWSTRTGGDQLVIFDPENVVVIDE